MPICSRFAASTAWSGLRQRNRRRGNQPVRAVERLEPRLPLAADLLSISAARPEAPGFPAGVGSKPRAEVYAGRLLTQGAAARAGRVAIASGPGVAPTGRVLAFRNLAWAVEPLTQPRLGATGTNGLFIG